LFLGYRSFDIDLVRQSNGPGNIQIANVKLPKYDAKISGMKINSRVRCFSLPEQKSVRCEIAVGMAILRGMSRIGDSTTP